MWFFSANLQDEVIQLYFHSSKDITKNFHVQGKNQTVSFVTVHSSLVGDA